MKYNVILTLFVCLIIKRGVAQNNMGIQFQAVARNSQGLIVSNKQITLRLSIIKDSSAGYLEYQEIKSVTTNILGLFFVRIGEPEQGKIISTGAFDTIQWDGNDKYLQVELSIDNDLNFIHLGIQKLSSVPFAYYAEHVKASNLNGIVSVLQGGTGVNSIKDLKTLLSIDKINNTPDSSKPANKTTLTLINDKLNKIDTSTLSTRINLKLNKADTIYMSNRIDLKLGAGDLTQNDILKTLNYTPIRSEYGSFYDTAKQTTLVSTATPIIWSFTMMANNTSITNNTSSMPTRITVTHAGVYKVSYTLQFIKPDIGNDEISVWIRRNSAAYAFTHRSIPIIGSNVKNLVDATYYVDLGDKDYVEVYYSVKNSSTSLMYSTTQLSPSRPATPCAMVRIERVN